VGGPDQPTRLDAPGTPVEATAHPGGAILELDTGDRLPVRGALVVGRSPDPSLGIPVRLEDRDRTISKSHFRILVEADGTWVEDLSSTNGTALRLPDGRTAVLRPGRRYPLVGGSRIRFGDRQARFVAD
jgi:pSer/pThr/pTyr-binding forkhead associated (FHA) protein